MLDWLRKLTHDALGWHDGKLSAHYFDGASLHARCSRCKCEVMMDSHGNWFTFKDDALKEQDNG